MKADTDTLRAIYALQPRLNIWQWNAANVDYSRAPGYETAWKGRYDPEYMPYWKEPCEAMTDPAVSEIWVLKCSRCGGSENLLLGTLRYHVAQAPVPMLYMSGQQQAAENFFEQRVKLGMALSPQTRAAYAEARVRDNIVSFPTCDLTVAWPANRMAFKGSGYAVVLGDEVSLYHASAADMLRERMVNWPFAHLACISSPDPAKHRPSDEDPIFQEHGKTDHREWLMPDPGGGEPFRFVMGGRDVPYGLKWEGRKPDGTWDLDRVRETAHYVTPAGARIDEAERMATVRRGFWQATKPGRKGIRGYRVTRFMVPFPEAGSFGTLAIRFLEATAKGPAGLRTFVYEFLAEPYYGERIVHADAEVEARRMPYRLRTAPESTEAIRRLVAGRKPLTLCAIDVQKDWLRYRIRRFWDGGDSALIDGGTETEWRKIQEACARWGVQKRFIDANYRERRNEVMEECLSGVMRGAVPTFGNDRLRMAFEAKERDPFEGTNRGGRAKLLFLTIHPDSIKNILHRLVTGKDRRSWWIPEDIDAEYIRWMTAEECIDGAWTKRRADNHDWDCEVMLLSGAMVFGVYREAALLSETDQPAAPIVGDTPRPPPARPRVTYG